MKHLKLENIRNNNHLNCHNFLSTCFYKTTEQSSVLYQFLAFFLKVLFQAHFFFGKLE